MEQAAINSVHSVKTIKKDGLNFQDRLEIKKLGPPRPALNIQQEAFVKGKTVKRHFNTGMYNNADWLCGCNLSNSFFCFVCLLMGSDDCDPAWVKTGVTDLKHLGEKIKKHSICQKHLNCSLEFATLGRVDIRNQLSSVYRLEILKHNDTVKQNRYILGRLIDCIKFCGAFELALRGHDERVDSQNPGIFRGLVNLMAEIDATLKSHIENSKNSAFSGLSKTIQNELLESILAVSQNVIRQQIQSADFIAIQADETTDNANITQLVFIVRYLHQCQIYERFVTFIQPTGHTAEQISDIILEELKKSNVDKTPDKLIAQSYDGAAVMSGEKNGVQAKIKSVYNKAEFVHCYAHQLNLILERAANQNKQVKVFFANVEGFAVFFSRSPKRTAVLDAIVQRRLPRGSNTRWNFSSRVVNTVFEYRDTIIECLEKIINEEVDKSTIRQATGLINYLNDGNFMFWLKFFHKILPHSDILYNQLQQRQLDSIKVKNSISVFSSSIQKIRDQLDLELNDDISEEIAPAKRQRYTDGNNQMAKEVCDVIITNVSSRFFSSDFLEASLLFETHSFQQYSKTFPENIFNKAVKTYPLNAIALKHELMTIYNRDDFRNANGALHVYQFLMQNNLGSVFPETIKLLKIICTIPMTTVESERCFSKLSRIKTFSRNTMGQDRLNALAMCSIEKELIQSIPNFNELVVDHFTAQKNRRMDFTYKT